MQSSSNTNNPLPLKCQTPKPPHFFHHSHPYQGHMSRSQPTQLLGTPNQYHIRKRQKQTQTKIIQKTTDKKYQQSSPYQQFGTLKTSPLANKTSPTNPATTTTTKSPPLEHTYSHTDAYTQHITLMQKRCALNPTLSRNGERHVQHPITRHNLHP